MRVIYWHFHIVFTLALSYVFILALFFFRFVVGAPCGTAVWQQKQRLGRPLYRLARRPRGRRIDLDARSQLAVARGGISFGLHDSCQNDLRCYMCMCPVFHEHATGQDRATRIQAIIATSEYQGNILMVL